MMADGASRLPARRRVPDLDLILTCDNFLYEGLQGTPSARRATRPSRARAVGAGNTRGCVLDGWEGRAVGGWGRRESRRRGGGSLARRLSAGAHGAGRCRRAVIPHPPPARPPAVTHPRWPRLHKRSGRPPRAGHSVAAKARRQGRYGLRPSRRLLRKRKPLTAGFPGKIWHLPGGGGESRHSSSAIRRPR